MRRTIGTILFVATTIMLCSGIFFLLSSVPSVSDNSQQLSKLNKIGFCVLRTAIDSSKFMSAESSDEESQAMVNYESNHQTMVEAFDGFSKIPPQNDQEKTLSDDARKLTDKIDRVVHKMREYWTSKSGGRMGIGKFQVMMTGMGKITEYTDTIVIKLNALQSLLESDSAHAKQTLLLGIGLTATSALSCFALTLINGAVHRSN